MRTIIGATFILLLALAGPAQAGSETCRDWMREHADWKAKVLGRYLADAPQRAIDEAVFGLLQREAYAEVWASGKASLGGGGGGRQVNNIQMIRPR